MIFQLLGLIFLSIKILLYNKRLNNQFFHDVKNKIIEINKANGVEIIQLRRQDSDLLSDFKEKESKNSEKTDDKTGEQSFGMTRDQIKLCIKKLDEIAKQKN